MHLILVAVVVLLCSGLFALLWGGKPSRANFLGVGGALLGCLIGIVPAAMILWTGQTEAIHWAWPVPYGSFFLYLDALSAFFLLPILGLSAVAALYGSRYLFSYRDRKNLGAAWFFFNLLVASMALVVLARNGVLFLLCWEAMSLASFFLVTFENEREGVRQAGWTYLVATHLGTAFLFILFILLSRGTGSMDFDGLTRASLPGTTAASLAFALAVIGFGTKAGFVPFHVWLPEAHPAAPSHVSAVMSGVMIKTGIYGLLRTLTFLGPPEPWWGWLLIGLGLVSGVMGVLFALAQHDLKRLLAYHSVENIGIIGLGLGLGVLGMALDQPVMAVLGLGGGLLHVLNHAMFKGLLFLGAGAVLHASHTREIDRLGGLIKRMPWTAAMFLAGSVAICGLPPLNGFVSEFLIYVAAFKGLWSSSTTLAAVAAIGGLGVIGGLAVACFTKAFGVVFQGEPRSAQAAQAREVDWGLRIPMILLASACLAIAFLAPQMIQLLRPVLEVMTGPSGEGLQNAISVVMYPLRSVVLLSALFLLVLALLAWGRRRLLAGRPVVEGVTWDCGYARPGARMQYSASSFAQPLTRMFNVILRIRRQGQEPHGFFPQRASLRTHGDDVFRDGFYAPIFQGIEWFMLRAHNLQQGRVQIYLLYVAVTVLVLLLWNLR